MIRAYAVGAVREAERRAMAGLPEGALMERAAAGLAEVVGARAAERAATRITVLAGPGDNGGDALLAAARLASGYAVTVVGVAERLHARGEEAVRAAGVTVHVVDPGAEGVPAVARAVLTRADVVVDGLLGIGGRAGLRGAMAAVARLLDRTAYVVAVDLPSGADPAGREPLGECVRADETVTFGMAKPVHLLPGTAPAVGRLTVVDIGVVPPQRSEVERLEPRDVASLWPAPGAGDHKYTRGVLGVVAGGERYPGAAVLCTTAAVEAGAGMVRYVGPPTPTGHVVQAAPEVVSGGGRVQAWVLGPGIDPEDGSAAGRGQLDAVRDALAGEEPCVVDAGALALVERRRAPTLLTPHAGELATLLHRLEPGGGPDRSAVEVDPVAAASRAAELTGATVLVKGSTTVIVPPQGDGTVRCQADAPAWLATAGAGDVLAGVAGVLLAAGLDPLDAGSLAALVHGRAAQRANPGGPVRALAVARSVPVEVAALLRF